MGLGGHRSMKHATLWLTVVAILDMLRDLFGWMA
jgi:hypothetical protein